MDPKRSRMARDAQVPQMKWILLSQDIRPSNLALETNREIVKRHLQLISQGDAKGAAGLFAPISLNHGRQVSRESIAKVFESLVMLEEHFTIHEMVAEGDWVACRATVTGRHSVQPSVPVGSGVYNLAQPLGQAYTIQHLHLFRVVGGQIVEHWANRDDLGAARQLGLELGPLNKERNS
jgi:predicted ester cyclase